MDNKRITFFESMSFPIDYEDFYSETRKASRHEELYDDSQARRFRRKSFGKRRLSVGVISENFEKDYYAESKRPIENHVSEGILYVSENSPDEEKTFRDRKCIASGERRHRRHSNRNRKLSLNLPILPYEEIYLNETAKPSEVDFDNDVEESSHIDTYHPDDSKEEETSMKDNAAQISPEEKEEVGNECERRTLDFTLKLHCLYRRIAVFAHGIMAGLAVAQCIFIYVFSNESTGILMKYYSRIAIPFQSLYYFLLSISLVSVFDRYCSLPCHWVQFLHHLIAKPRRAITLISYMLSLIFSVSLALLDDSISFYDEIPSFSPSSRQLHNWKILNTFRAVTAFLAWLAIDVAAEEDETASGIEKMIANEKGDVQVMPEDIRSNTTLDT